MDAIETVRKAILLFFMGFPVIMGSLVGFLSAGLLNTGMMILFAGQIIVVPLAVILLHLMTWPLPKVPASDLGMIVPSFGVVLTDQSFNVSPSFWVAQVVFLFSYIFTNALTVYQKEAAVSTSAYSWKVENRKARAYMIMAVSVLFLAILLGIRYFITNTETLLGMIIGLAAFAPLGWGWYQVAIKSGSQSGDVFGIVSQMIPILEEDKNATVCMPA
jgi:hypothetical protein